MTDSDSPQTSRRPDKAFTPSTASTVGDAENVTVPGARLADVVYPPVGIAHVTRRMVDYVSHVSANSRTLVVNTSAQPNSHPHLGTVTTLLAAFALARRLREDLGIPAIVSFDALENSPSPGEKQTIDGLIFQRSLADTPPTETVEHRPGTNIASLAEEYLVSFREILDAASMRAGVPYVIRTYAEFQGLPEVRRGLLDIIRLRDRIAPIVAPTEHALHVRFPCPVCRYVEKSAATLRVVYSTEDEAVLEARCFEHGTHRAILREHSGDFIDTNAALRDVIKGLLFAEVWRRDAELTVMCDGGDWTLAWPLRVFAEALTALDKPYAGIPVRLFAPVIVDWSGAKFSKSLYVAGGAYAYLPRGLIDYSHFREQFGGEGFDALWREAVRWVDDPKRFFRNYSITYFDLVLREAL